MTDEKPSSRAPLRLVVLLLGLFVSLSLILRAQFTHKGSTSTGCMGECPAAPPGCERTRVDPGSCADTACTTPAPTCRYAAVEAGAVCPPTLVGRCIAP